MATNEISYWSDCALANLLVPNFTEIILEVDPNRKGIHRVGVINVFSPLLR